MPSTKQKILSLQEVGKKHKIVVKIEFTPLSHSPDRKILPFKKGFKKWQAPLHPEDTFWWCKWRLCPNMFDMVKNLTFDFTTTWWRNGIALQKFEITP